MNLDASPGAALSDEQRDALARAEEAAVAEAFRVLRPGGALLAGLDNGINYLFDEAEERIVRSLP